MYNVNTLGTYYGLVEIAPHRIYNITTPNLILLLFMMMINRDCKKLRIVGVNEVFLHLDLQRRWSTWVSISWSWIWRLYYFYGSQRNCEYDRIKYLNYHQLLLSKKFIIRFSEPTWEFINSYEMTHRANALQKLDASLYRWFWTLIKIGHA